MATDNNIKNFTGADIEKYHKGLLSAKERHDLEKAALDDPFLAEALEGYAVAGVDYSADMDGLKKRLAEKVEAGKLIVMKTGGRSSFPWLRAAALVILIAGAGLLAKQFIFNNPSKNIAQVETKKAGETKFNDSANTLAITAGTDTVKTKPGTFVVPLKQNAKTYTFITTDSVAEGTVSKNANGQGNVTTGDVTVTNNATQPVVTAPVKIEDEKINQYKVPAGNAEKKEIAKAEVKDKMERDEAKGFVSQPGNDIQNNRAGAVSRKATEDQNPRQVTNTFRGRVTDANNVGLPFARVFNPSDNNAGTYTDVAGNFNLTYPDSVLTVQVKSVGFENANVQLRNSVPNNQVVLQDDKSLSEVVISNQKPNAAARSREANKTLEEPEPADGWDNYDTYLSNNLNVPEEIKTKQNASGEVQVSFEVDKNGEPVNIKVEKSLCKKCDKEAIRLIKDGPKWKRNAKNGRTTVTISFDHSL
ncbi:MAG TPA: carboxypeptidase-like regulatory domain-containing protein [Chitinophagaceae bacterium]